MDMESRSLLPHSDTNHDLRNTLVLSFSFMLIFTAYMAIEALQSSLNQDEGLGITSLSCLYAFALLSSVLSPLFIKALGCKNVLIAGWICHIIYTCTNFYPSWSTLIPSSILLGSISGPVWTSQGLFITAYSYSLAAENEVELRVALSRLNGVFVAIFMTTSLTGNLISSLVLFQDFSNNTGTFDTGKVCGADDCPGMTNRTILVQPEQYIVHTLLGVFLACEFLGLFLTIFFQPRLESSRWVKDTSLKESITACLSGHRDWKLTLMIPFNMSMAIVEAIIAADFTKEFVSCPVGIRMVGFVMAAYGGASIFSAVVMSYLEKYLRHRILFAMAAFFNINVYVAMILWKPNADNGLYSFLLAIPWGLAEGIWLAQSNALIGLFFPSMREQAFASYHTAKGIGFTMTFALGNVLCVSIKLYSAAGFLVFSLILYSVVEASQHVKPSTWSSGYDACLATGKSGVSIPGQVNKLKGEAHVTEVRSCTVDELFEIKDKSLVSQATPPTVDRTCI
ncbi:hypothetical protein ScPMuIL_007790 [Solemya velum]